MTRTVALALVLADTISCAESHVPAPIYISDFVARSAQVRCTPSPIGSGEAAVGQVVTVSDTSFLVLYPNEREVALYGPDLVVRHTVSYEKAGPQGVLGPESIALVGDTLLYFADRPRHLVKALDLSGRDRGATRLDLPPQSLSPSAQGLLVVPLVLGNSPQQLVYRLVGGQLHPLDVPVARFAHWQIQTLANLVALATYPNGRAVIAHRFLVPTAYLVDDMPTPSIEPVQIPLPDGVRANVGYVPEPPFTERGLMNIVAPVLAAAPDFRTGDFLYLTRSGRSANGHLEKAIVRVDARFQYQRSYLLDVNAGHLTYLPDQQTSLVVDEEDRWFRCSTP